MAARRGQNDEAIQLYRVAAEGEERALETIEPDKLRTLGITAVSAASLWYMAQEYARAQQLAHSLLAGGRLPPFAAAQLRDLLQEVWGAEIRQAAGVKFLPGDVVVSVRGGLVVYGGAPLDLILSKVEEIRAVIIRTVEMKLKLPLRRGRTPSEFVRQFFQPWLFQQPAGSYQFAVRVREPDQLEAFASERPDVETVATSALEILRASAEDPDGALVQLVPDPDYRTTFLTLARNLAPTGDTFQELRVGSASAPAAPVVLVPVMREAMNVSLRLQRPTADKDQTPVQLRGTLRGLSLNRDWLEIRVTREDGTTEDVQVFDAGETLDDIIGPMVNRAVIVDAYRRKSSKRLHLQDIQPVE
jgi:hypothetical protein